MLNSLNSSKSVTSLDINIIQFLGCHNLLTQGVQNAVKKAKNKASIFVSLRRLNNGKLLTKMIVDAVFCHSDPECLLQSMIDLNKEGIWKDLTFLDKLAFFNHKNPLNFSKGIICLKENGLWESLSRDEKERFYHHRDPLCFARGHVELKKLSDSCKEFFKSDFSNESNNSEQKNNDSSVIESGSSFWSGKCKPLTGLPQKTQDSDDYRSRGMQPLNCSG